MYLWISSTLSSHLGRHAVLRVSNGKVKLQFGWGGLVLIGLWCWTVRVKAVAGITVCEILVLVEEVITGFVVFSLVVNELKDVHSQQLALCYKSKQKRTSGFGVLKVPAEVANESQSNGSLVQAYKI